MSLRRKKLINRITRVISATSKQVNAFDINKQVQSFGEAESK